MLTYLKWAFWIVFWTLIAAFFHYTLPRHDIVRIVDTYETRVTFGENSIFWTHARTGNAGGQISRDVFFIQAIKENGRARVYRNEDTGAGWPPYFKFETANLQARAADLRSTAESPIWVAVKYYGWRSEFLTVFPNALRVRQVSGPDVTIIPWTAIIVLASFACLVWFIWARWRRFWKRREARLLDGDGAEV